MSQLLTLRVLVNERLTAAAEEIFALFEMTIAEYEEKLCRSEQENQRKQRELNEVNQTVLLPTGGARTQTPSPSPPGPGLKEEITEQIKEEPKEHSVTQKEEQVSEFVTEFSAVCVKTEESFLLQQTQTELHEEAQEKNINSKSHFSSEIEENTVYISDKGAGSITAEECWTCPATPGSARMETEADKTVCKKTLVSKLHLQQHTDERPYSCQLCPKAFTFASDLRRHRMIHSSDKPYSCSLCKKTFSRKSCLVVHTRTHTGDKPFSCPLCQRPFTDRSNLRSHMRSHTTEKPYSCSLCPKTFAYSSSLWNHVSAKHKGKPELN